jgi:DNA polymerase-3 subunit delta'
MPIRLDAIRGHDAAVADLVRRYAQGRVPHAILLEGPDGVGKRALAEAFVGLLLCERPDGGGACGACPACVKLDAGGHPDLHWLPLREEAPAPAKPKPVRKGKPAEDAAPPAPPPYRRYIKVDDVRALERVLRLRSLEGRAKVAVIDEAHRMGPGAHPQNALLKTLEEPPRDTHLVLVTSRRRALLPTILSRCQTIHLAPLSPDALEAVLRREAPDLDEATRRFLVAFAEGSPGRGLALEVEALRERQERVADLDAGLEPGSERSGPVLDAALNLGEDRADLGGHLEAWAAWARDVALVAAGVAERIVHVDERPRLETLARSRGLAESLRRADAVLEARRQLDLPNNLNSKLVVEQLCLTLLDHVPLRRLRA